MRFILFLACIMIFASCQKDPINDGRNIGNDLVIAEGVEPVDQSTMSTFQNEMLEAINEVRAAGCKCGDEQMPPVPALYWHPDLEEAANLHASDMVENNFFSHTSSNGDQLNDRLDKIGYNWSHASENLAEGEAPISTILVHFQNSPSHCKVMMSENPMEVGSAKVGKLWAVVFGHRR